MPRTGGPIYGDRRRGGGGEGGEGKGEGEGITLGGRSANKRGDAGGRSQVSLDGEN